MYSKTANNLKWTLVEILNVIKTVYEEGKSYTDAELQESLLVIFSDLKGFFTKYGEQHASPIGSRNSVDIAVCKAYSAFTEYASQLISNNLLTKKHLETEDLEVINKNLVRIDEDLTVLRLEIERTEG